MGMITREEAIKQANTIFKNQKKELEKHSYKYSYTEAIERLKAMYQSHIEYNLIRSLRNVLYNIQIEKQNSLK